MNPCDLPIIACAALIIIIIVMLCKAIEACNRCDEYVAERESTATIFGSTSGNTNASSDAATDKPIETAFKLDDIQKAFSDCEKEYGVGNCIMKDGVIQRI